MTPLPQIEIQNAQRKLRLGVAPLQRFAEHALKLVLKQSSALESKLEGLRQVCVLLVSDRRMAALHKKFTGLEGPTDVLTFQHGEIFISVETAQQNALRFQTAVEHELQLYLVHGLLHLHGFDDIGARDARRMDRIQQRILAAVPTA